MSGVGVLIVGALGAFVWYEYKDTVGLLIQTEIKLDNAVEQLNTTKKAFSQQTEINEKLGARLKQVHAVASSLVKLAEQDRPDQGQNQDDLENLEELLSETSLRPAGGEEDLNSLIDKQAELLAELPMSN